ncbi:hypothetical protein ABTD90_19235, partial [Acinetobacter baumannii]
DGAAGTVQPVAVTLGQPIGNEIEVSSGLRPGQTIVTAGVHLLKPGQKVRPLQTLAPASAPAAPPASTPTSAPASAPAARS